MAIANLKARLRRAASFVRLERLEGRELLASFLVTSVADSGPGSLRQAILDNNVTAGDNTISFNIPGSGARSIALTSPLPAISNPATIDATTQPGYSGTPLVELNGANIFQPGVTPPVPIPSVDGLLLSGGSTVVRGLAINRFTGPGIRMTRDGNTIAANFIGTDPTGTRSLGNGSDGIVVSSRNNLIGGIDAAGRNVISGNASDGIFLASIGNQSANNVIRGNYIGTDVTGGEDLGNAGDGILVLSSGNVIGGSTAPEGNIIAFNGSAGVQVGFFFTSTNRDRISRNSIFLNTGLGIDLGGDGVTFGGSGARPNQGLSFPTLTSAYSSDGATTIEGSISAAANTSITVEFFSNDQADPTGFGEGRTFLGSETILTDGSGRADITTTLSTSVPTGQFISATATDGSGNTSEFARSISVAASAQADLSVSSQDFDLTAQATVSRTYSYSIRNDGPSRATNVVAVDTLPQGAVFLSGTSSQGTLVPSGGAVTINVGTLESGATAQFTLTYSLPTAGAALNTVAVRSDQADPTLGDNTITQNFQVLPAPAIDLSLFGSGIPDQVQVGEDLTYTFVVTNLDFANKATGVTLTDVLPTGVEFVSARPTQGTATVVDGTVTVNFGTLNPNFNAVVTIVVRPTTPGSLTNSATLIGNEADSNALNNQAAVVNFVAPAPATDLLVLVTAAPQPAQVGRGFTYGILVGNAGSALATNVALTNLLPDAATILSITPSQGTISVVNGVLTAELGSLAPGALAEVTVVLQPGAPGMIVDQASVTSDQPDFNIGNNYSTLGTLVTADGSAPTILNQRLIASRNGITGIVLTFDKALDPTLAVAKDNYQLLDLGQNGSKSANGPNVAIASVTYDPASRSVILVPRKALKIGRFYKLIVNGEGAPGVVDTSGNVLDGVGNGLQNSAYTSLIARGTSSRPTDVQQRTGTSHNPSKQGPKARAAAAKAVVVKASAVPIKTASKVSVAQKRD